MVSQKVGFSEKVFDVFNTVFMILVAVVSIYPMLYSLFASLSDVHKLAQHQGLLLRPLGLSLKAYEVVFKNPDILRGYRNTLFVVVFGVGVNLVMTSLGAFFLTRRNVLLKNFIMVMITITMFFNGGLVPFYLTVQKIGLMNSLWALIVPTAINTFNMIIMRTYFSTIPYEMEESAMIDGANQFIILIKIILPVSTPIIAVMALYYGVDHWNSWFHAMIFLRDRNLFPLQLILREILVISSLQHMLNDIQSQDLQEVEMTIKYATIIVATVPILALYPFLQKYFVKGVMIGALKG